MTVLAFLLMQLLHGLLSPGPEGPLPPTPAGEELQPAQPTLFTSLGLL